MTPALWLQLVVNPTLAWLDTLGVRSVTDPAHDKARVMLLAIPGQESGWRHREQVGGPAHGLYQFERGGGVRGVLTHRLSSPVARDVCNALLVYPSETPVYDALVNNDALACAFARLLLWTDPRALPDVGDQDGAWALYNRTWRPGKPHPDRWGANYSAAVSIVQRRG